MEQSDLLRKIAQTFEGLGVTYLVVGSLASVIYGEPRYTNDIDVVVDLGSEHLNSLCDAFPSPEFYLSRSAAESAIHKRFQFNIIHPASGLKVDCILPTSSEYDRMQLQRGHRLRRSGSDQSVVFGSPEDVIIKKMEYYREGGSEKHLRDITGVLKVQGEKIDRQYVRVWSEKLGLVPIWEAILQRLAQG